MRGREQDCTSKIRVHSGFDRRYDVVPARGVDARVLRVFRDIFNTDAGLSRFGRTAAACVDIAPNSNRNWIKTFPFANPITSIWLDGSTKSYAQPLSLPLSSPRRERELPRFRPKFQGIEPRGRNNGRCDGMTGRKPCRSSNSWARSLSASRTTAQIPESSPSRLIRLSASANNNEPSPFPTLDQGGMPRCSASGR
jgi:hypothetical protein